MASRVLRYCIVMFIVNIVAVCGFMVTERTAGEQSIYCSENEEYYKCSLEACFTKCSDLENPPHCPVVEPDCYVPACMCKQSYLRNSQGACVPAFQCESFWNGVFKKKHNSGR